MLAEGERSVDELAGEIAQSTANTSHHLQALARAGLVASRRDGTRICTTGSPALRSSSWWSARRGVATGHVAGINDLARAYLGDRSQLEAISREELLACLRRGDILVLDIRPDAEFRAGHIPGARSIPPTELQLGCDALPRDVEVVAYCRGPFCADDADDAVRRPEPGRPPRAAPRRRLRRMARRRPARQHLTSGTLCMVLQPWKCEWR